MRNFFFFFYKPIFYLLVSFSIVRTRIYGRNILNSGLRTGPARRSVLFVIFVVQTSSFEHEISTDKTTYTTAYDRPTEGKRRHFSTRKKINGLQYNIYVTNNMRVVRNKILPKQHMIYSGGAGNEIFTFPCPGSRPQFFLVLSIQALLIY